MTTRRILLLLLGTVAAGSPAGCAGPARPSLPQREIERPLVLPHRMWQGSAHAGIRYAGDSVAYDLSFIPFFWRYSALPRLELPSFPWRPYVRYQIDKPHVDINNEVIANPHSWVLSGGMTSSIYSGLMGRGVAFSAGLEHRSILASVMWIDAAGHLGATTKGSLDIDLAAGTGFQVTRALAVWVGYAPASRSPNGEISTDALVRSTRHTVSATVGWNYHPGLSLALRPAVTAHDRDVDLNVGLIFSYQK